MRRYHKLEWRERESTDRRQFQAPAPVAAPSATELLIQGLLAKAHLIETGATYICPECGAKYRHEVETLPLCLCCEAPITTNPNYRS